jgi:acyl transferase domain-containing protein
MPAQEHIGIAVVGMAVPSPPDSDAPQSWDAGDPGGDDEADAAYFGLSRPEIGDLDAAVRLFLRCAATALEDAGHDPTTSPERLGVYCGPESDDGSPGTGHLAAAVAEVFGAAGPAMTVQGGAATAALALHLAVLGLHGGDCDLALAGAVDVFEPDGTGGARRGAGALVLRSLEAALADHDRIYAVIRGSAVGHDGGRRAGWSVNARRQAGVITAALRRAALQPADVGLLLPGTATPARRMRAVASAVRSVFGADPGVRVLGGSAPDDRTRAAAATADVLAPVLALHHGRIPAAPAGHPLLSDLTSATGSFVAPEQAAAWDANGTRPPRTAAVGAAGADGTYAHVVLTAAPTPPARPDFPPAPQLLPLSAATPAALTVLCDRLGNHLRAGSAGSLADVAYTLQTGRRALPYRRFVVAATVAEAADRLAAASGADVALPDPVRVPRRPVLLFPGLGMQRRGAAADLYRRAHTYRTWVDQCVGWLDPALGSAVLDELTGESPQPPPADPLAALRSQRPPVPPGRTVVTHPALFISEFALARQLMAWGVTPAAVIGHSLGEYVAACVAGVLPIEDAVRIVAARAQLIAGVSRGAMLAVPLPEDRLRGYLRSGAGIAAVNARGSCVLSGDESTLEQIGAELAEAGVASRMVDAEHAFHSPALQPVAGELVRQVGMVALSAPALPCVSTVTGTWLTADEATDPGYWGRHLCATVRFHDGLGTLLADPDHVLLEVGHGDMLSGYARQHTLMTRARLGRVLTTFAPGRPPAPDPLLTVLGDLWSLGVMIAWPAQHRPGTRARVPVPTHPFGA